MIRLLWAVLSIVLLSSCGRAPDPATSSTPAPVAAPVSAPILTAPTSSSSLAVALEGDVQNLGDTLYKATGPEIRCSAMIVDSGEARPATSEVDWKVAPMTAGSFSMGTRGAFFMPTESGTVEIYAELPVDGAPARVSPRLSLSLR